MNPYDSETVARGRVEAFLRGNPGKFYCSFCLVKAAPPGLWTHRQAQFAVDGLFETPMAFTKLSSWGCSGCSRKARAVGQAGYTRPLDA